MIGSVFVVAIGVTLALVAFRYPRQLAAGFFFMITVLLAIIAVFSATAPSQTPSEPRILAASTEAPPPPVRQAQATTRPAPLPPGTPPPPALSMFRVYIGPNGATACTTPDDLATVTRDGPLPKYCWQLPAGPVGAWLIMKRTTRAINDYGRKHGLVYDLVCIMPIQDRAYPCVWTYAGDLVQQ